MRERGTRYAVKPALYGLHIRCYTMKAEGFAGYCITLPDSFE